MFIRDNLNKSDVNKEHYASLNTISLIVLGIMISKIVII